MPRIAIYSKEIPTTTFIENLVVLLSENGYEIYLFGQQKKEMNYKGSVVIKPTPTRLLPLVFFVIYQWLALLIKNPGKAIKTVKYSFSKGGLWAALKNLGILLPILNTKLDCFHIQWANDLQSNPEFFDLLDCPIDLSLRGAHINYAPLMRKGLADSYRKLFPRILRFHAVSQAIGSEAEKYGAPADRIQVVYSSVRGAILERYRKRDFCNIQQIRLLSVGRFHWKKGYQYALQAVHTLIQEGISVHYTIIAQGIIPEEIIYMIHELGLKEYISIINGLPQDEVVKMMQEYDLFLLPSVEEGIANVVLEAMAVGTPVISTDCGGMLEVIRDGENGFIVPVRDSRAITAAVKKYIHLPLSEIGALSEKAHQTIMKQHTHETMLKGFQEFYKN